MTLPIGLVGNTNEGEAIVAQSASTLFGLRLLMTIIPILGLVVAYILFSKKFILSDQKMEEIVDTLKERRSAA